MRTSRARSRPADEVADAEAMFLSQSSESIALCLLYLLNVTHPLCRPAIPRYQSFLTMKGSSFELLFSNCHVVSRRKEQEGCEGTATVAFASCSIVPTALRRQRRSALNAGMCATPRSPYTLRACNVPMVFLGKIVKYGINSQLLILLYQGCPFAIAVKE